MPAGYVQRVVDGDTIDIRAGPRIRPQVVDAPELHHPGGLVAWFALQELVGGRWIRYYQHAVDVFGRVVADVWVDGVWANGHMRRMGYG
jgi:endonuclease YncB( thermonuclease family)